MADNDTKSRRAEEPMLHDPNLPKGWSRKVIQRKLGNSAGQHDVYLFSPSGKKFRSKAELSKFLKSSKSDMSVDNFDFSVTGNDGKKMNRNSKSSRATKSTQRSQRSANSTKITHSPRKRKLQEEEEKEEDTSSSKRSKPTKSGPAKKLVVKMPFSAGTRKTPRRNASGMTSAVEEDGVNGAKRSSRSAGEKVEQISSTSTRRQKGTVSIEKPVKQGRGRPRKVQLSPAKATVGKRGKPSEKIVTVKKLKIGTDVTQKKSADKKLTTDQIEPPKKRGRPSSRTPVSENTTDKDKHKDVAPVVPEKEAQRKTARIIKSPRKDDMVETNPVNILGTGAKKRGRPPKLKGEEKVDVDVKKDGPKKRKLTQKKKSELGPQENKSKRGKRELPNAKTDKTREDVSGLKLKAKKAPKRDNAQGRSSSRQSTKFADTTQAMQDNLLAPLPELPEPFLSDSSNTETSGSESAHMSASSGKIRGRSLTESYPVLSEAMQTKAGVILLDHSYATASPVAVKPTKVVHLKHKLDADPAPVQVAPKAKKVVSSARKRSISETNVPKQTVIKLNRAPQNPVKPQLTPKILYTMNPQQVPKTLPQQIFATSSNTAPPVSPGSTRSLILPQTLAAVQAGNKSTATQAKVISFPTGKGGGVTQSIISIPGGGQIIAQASTKLGEGGKVITLPIPQGLITQSNVVSVPVKGLRSPIAQNPNVITMSMGNTSPISPSNLTAIQFGTVPPKGAKRISFSVGVPPKAIVEKSETVPANNETPAPGQSSSPKQRSA